MRKTTFLSALLLLIPGIINAQVQVDKRIELTGSGNNARITGIDSVASSSDVVDVKTLQKGRLIYAEAIGVDGIYSVNLNPPVNNYDGGMIVNFKANHDTPGAATLNVNGLGAQSIKKYISEEIEEDDIKSGQMVTVIYDGSSFQITSPLSAPPTSNTSNLVYTLSADKAQVLTNPGFTTQHDPVTITATLGSGFAAVALSITGLPSGVTYSISPGGGFPTFSSVVVFSAAPETVPGTYPLTITGDGGVAVQTVALTLNIYAVKKVFVSNSTLGGNALLISANNLCNSEASGAGLSGTYKAWISNGSSNNVSATSALTYRRVDNAMVAWDWTDLTDGSIANAIELTANGGNYNGNVWTGLNNNGAVNSNSCSNWTTQSTSIQGMQGRSTSTGGWSNYESVNCGTGPVYMTETLNATNCTTCFPGSTATFMGFCGNGCSGTFMGSNCTSSQASNPNSNFYQCWMPSGPTMSRVYCVQQ